MPLLANINVGTTPNDGTGDSIRDSFIIVNENFQFIESFFPNTSNIDLVANITSTGLSTFNNLTANNVTVGNLSANISGNITGNLIGTVYGNVVGSTVAAATIGNSGATLTGTLSTAAQTNITSVGTLTGLTLNGGFTGTSVSAATIGNTDAILTGTLSTAAQTNITSVGTLANLTVSGNIGTGNISGNVHTSHITYAVYNGTNVGNVTSYTVQFLPNNSSRKLIEINSNITISYSGTITSGLAHHLYIKNRGSGVANIILPDTNNNLGTTVVWVTNGTVAYLEFTPFDTTSGNIMVFVANR